MSFQDATDAERAQLTAPVAGMEVVVDAGLSLEIADDDDYQLAAELLAQVAAALKGIETERVALTRPLNEVVRRINQAAKDAAGELPDASNALREKMATFRADQEKARYDAKVAAQAAAGQDVVDPGGLPAPAAKSVSTSSGLNVNSRKRWTFEVLDAHALAKACSKSKKAWEEHGDLVMPAPTYINQAIKAGLREFPGLRIYESESMVVR